MGRSPLVTIGMPVHNGQHVMHEALDSVLAQTVTDFELILADNASTDQTEAVCREYARSDSRIRYYRHPHNLGAARNFNFTFEQSRGAYFKWIAHDDVIAPTYLERCLERFRQGPASLSLCYARRQVMSPEGTLVPHAERPPGTTAGEAAVPGPTFRELLQRPADECPMFVFGLIRAEALRRTRLVGAFPSADLVLVAELRLLGPFGEVPRPLYYQRRHGHDAQWLARASKRGETQWYDPHAATERVSSSWKLFIEHLRGIATRPISPLEKTRAYAAMAGYFPHRIRRLIRNGTLVHRLKEELRPSADPRLY